MLFVDEDGAALDDAAVPGELADEAPDEEP